MQATGGRTAAALILSIALLSAVAVASREPVRGPIGVETQRRSQVSAATPAPSHELDDLAPVVVTYDSGSRSATPDWQWWALAALGLTGLAAAAVLLVPELRRWMRARRERRAAFVATPGPTVGEATRTDEAEVVQRALDAASAPLRDPADPRSAVIEAYARMEQALAERDLGRRAPEAPREYLTRVLGEHGAPQQSLATITALFEEARFSHHPIPPSAPRRALRELENARAALASLEVPG
jgi:Domain of unknown function (DUF4129)